MKITLDNQIVWFERWRRDRAVDASFVDVFQRTRNTVLEAGAERIDAFDLLVELAGMPSLGGTESYEQLGLNPGYLKNWSVTAAGLEARNAGVTSDITLDSVSDALKAIEVYNASITVETYRSYRPYELAIGVIASTSKMVEGYFKHNNLSRMGLLREKLGLSEEQCRMLLDVRKTQSKRQVRTRLRSR